MRYMFIFFGIFSICFANFMESIISIRPNDGSNIKFCNGIAISTDTILTTKDCLNYITEINVNNGYLNYSILNDNFIIYKGNFSGLKFTTIDVTPDVLPINSINVYAWNFISYPVYQSTITKLNVEPVFNKKDCTIKSNFDENIYLCYTYYNTNLEPSFASGAISSIVTNFVNSDYKIIGFGSPIFTKDSTNKQTSLYYKFDQKFVDNLYDIDNHKWNEIELINCGTEEICEICEICEDCEECNSSKLTVNFVLFLFVIYFLFL